MKKIRLIWLFYRNFCFAAWLITLACLILFLEYGYNIFSVLCWLKAITLGFIYQFIRSYKSNEFYYFRNLGVSSRLLWIATFGFDIFIFLTLGTTHPIREHHDLDRLGYVRG